MLLVLTVLYKLTPSQSASLQSLAGCVRSGLDIRSVVWDNSPDRSDERDLAWLQQNLPGSVYRHTPENMALSRIYNSIIGEYLQQGETSPFAGLFILDQDSSFGPELLDEAADAMARHADVGLFLPHVVSNDAIVSPATVYGCIGLPWRTKHVGRVSSRRTLAINSGMIIRRDYLARRFSGYDERLRFYGTDNDFCRKYAATERWMYVLDSEVKHSLARDVDEPSDVRLWRHRENVRALLLTNSGDWFTRTTCRLYCVGYCSKTAILERDVRFLRWE
jgi:GT2 family glycosyltransferase